ncbi:MAG: type-F conjugative transfer system protein TraW [Betaproteobacteria bacterium]|nr:type-F conjugative transfer system protein TraW [Betaproteobacteria bacterium]
MLASPGVLLPWSPVAAALDLGVIGPTTPIAEPDLLLELQAKLREKARSGELQQWADAARQRTVASIRTPPAVPGLTRSAHARSFYFDPTVHVAQPLVDAQGQVLVAAGTRVNPLTIVSLSQRLLFFDARDAAQVRQARALIEHYGGKVKPILVAGSYLDLMRQWRFSVYYDQQGTLVQKLGITQVPALVSQEGPRLRIDELATAR